MKNPWVITSDPKRLKLIWKFSEIMPLYPTGAFRSEDNGLIHSISFKPVVYQPAQPQMDGRCMMLQFLANPIFTQFAKALTCNIHLHYIFTLGQYLIQYRYRIWALLNLVLYCISGSRSYCDCLKQSSLKFATRIRCPKSWGSIVSGSA